MSVFDPGLPSLRQIESYIKDKDKFKVEIALINNEKFIGKVLWQDPNCICLIEENTEKKILIWLQGIAYIKLADS